MKMFIADDHKLFRKPLIEFIQHTFDGATILEADDWDALLEGDPDQDLVLIDLNMPSKRGRGDVREAVDHFKGAAVVVISGQESPDLADEALRAGARGFIPKTTSPTAMVQILKLVLEGEIYAPPTDSNRRAAPTPLRSLTQREMEVLRCVAQGMSNKEIAQRLNLREVTIKVHLRNIFEKIQVKNRTQAALVYNQTGRS